MVGPFAELLATTGHEPGIVYADLDFTQAGVCRFEYGNHASQRIVARAGSAPCDWMGDRWWQPLRVLCWSTQVKERRTNMPLTQQRRSDLYGLVDKQATN